jgi:hypothetical protein
MVGVVTMICDTSDFDRIEWSESRIDEPLAPPGTRWDLQA